MRSKLFKKLVAGIATLAMAAQFGFVLPASAAEIYTQDYNSVADLDALKEIWTAQEAGALKLGTDDEHGNYMSYDFTGLNKNSRGAETSFTANTAGKESYVVEFDAALTAGNGQDTHFAIKTSNFKYSGNVNDGAGSGYLFKMVAAPNSATWTLNDVAANTATIKAGEWHHYKLVVDTLKKLTSATITDSTGTAVLDKVVLPINGDAVDIKGIYMRAGRYYPVMSIDNIVVRDRETDDEFGEVGEEALSSISFASDINKVITQPAEGTPYSQLISVKAQGIYGGDLTDKVSYEWSTTGLANEDGYIALSNDPKTVESGAAPWDTGSSGEEITGSQAYLSVGHGVSNYFGSVNVKVTYEDEERTISTPFAVIGASGGGGIAPAAGYPEDMSDYDNSLIGYSGTTTGNISGKDIVLNNWTIYGGNAQPLSLETSNQTTTNSKGEETLEKYLKLSGTGNSAVGVYQLADQKLQYIIDMTVQFAGGSPTIGHFYDGPNNSSDRWKHSWSINYSGGALTVGTQSISGLNSTDWFRVIISADESVGTFYVKVYNADGELVGEALDETLASTYKESQRYFCLAPGNGTTNLKKFSVYYPTVGSIAITGSDTISVPSADEVAGKGLENSEVYDYDSEAKKLTVTLDDTTEAKLIVAQYDGRKLKKFDDYQLIFTEGKAEVDDFIMPDSCKLMVWDSFDGMKPIIPAEGTGVNNPNYVAQKAEIDLNAIVETSEGFGITGDVTWEIDTDDEMIELEEDGQSATLYVAEGAPAGTVTVTARYGSSSVEKQINLTTTGNSITSKASATSLTIPFAGGEAVSAEFEAYTVDKDGNKNAFAFDDDGNATTTPATIEYSILDKNLRDITENLPAGITITENDGKLTLTATDAAKPAVIYVRAKNNDVTPLTRDTKVNIHGLSFAFGSDAPADDSYTQVTTEGYSDKLGYGFADASKLTLNKSDITSANDFQFKVKVPNGNYQVKLTGSGCVLSETVEGISASTGITELNAKVGMTKQTDYQFNVAVVDEILDLTFANEGAVTENGVTTTYNPTPLVEKLEITQIAEKKANTKPTVFAIGDSTTDNKGNSWGNAGNSVIGNYTNLGSFSNHGKAGDDSVVYYNSGRVENILLAICPGDIVTVNMGINSKAPGEPASYYTMLDKYYVEAIQQRGGIPVMVTATPQGPVGNFTGNYSNGVFTCNRGDGAHNNDLRNIAKTRDLDIIELGYWGDEYFNSLTEADATAAGKSSVLELVQSWYSDHNHYQEPLATTIANHILSIVNEIAADDYDGTYNWKNDTHITQ